MTVQGNGLETIVQSRKDYLSRRLRVPSIGVRRESREIIDAAVEDMVRREVMAAVQNVFAASQGSGQNGSAGSPFGFGGDGRQAELTLDRMIADILVNGRQTSGVLRALFGLVPVLAGR